MSSSRYEPHQRNHNQYTNTAAAGGSCGRQHNSTAGRQATTNCAAGGTTTPPMSAPTATPTPVLEQIADLLNLAQNLMSGFKQQHGLPPAAGARNGGTCSWRNNRHHATVTPYQRASSEARRALHYLNTNSRANSHGNGGGGGSSQLSATQFCNCGECNAQKLRSQVAVVRHGDGVDAGGSGGTSDQAAGSHQQPHCSNSKNFQCSICLESYLPQRPMATLCGHIFCRFCILECLNRQGKCPICNRKLSLTNVFRVFF